jgi:hypothetical protein
MACTLAESPSDPLHRKLRQLRCLRCRFDCYRVERTSSRAGVAPAEVQRLSRRTVTPTICAQCTGTIATLVGLYFYFRPNVEIEVPSSNLTDSESLFYRPFVIRNNSPWLSVYDVHVMCTVQRVVRGSPDKPAVEFMNASPDYVPPIRELVAGERHSVPCMENIQSKKPIISADVVLSLDYYRPRVFFGHTATGQGYRAVLGTDGSAYWTPYVEHP